MYCFNIGTVDKQNVHVENKVLRKTNDVSNVRIVDAKHVLWTCHKACKIEHFDCSFCMCSVCYTTQTNNMETPVTNSDKKKGKRRRTSRSIDDDDNTKCKHNITDLVPFMDQSFFSQKYKATIALEKYKLPVACSICECELVDRVGPSESSRKIIAI